MNKKSYIKLEEINLPFDELVLGDDELFVIKGGDNCGCNRSGIDCGCGCGCTSGNGCGCGCANGSGCGCGTGSGCGCGCCVCDECNPCDDK